MKLDWTLDEFWTGFWTGLGYQIIISSHTSTYVQSFVTRVYTPVNKI